MMSLARKRPNMRIPLNFAQMTFEISYAMGIGMFTLIGSPLTLHTISPRFYWFTHISPHYVRFHPINFTLFSPQILINFTKKNISDNKRYGNGNVRIEVSTPFSSTISTDPAPISASIIFTHESKIDFDEHFIGNWSTDRPGIVH